MAAALKRPESPASDIFSTVVFKSEDDTPYATVVHKSDDTYDTVVHRVGGGGTANASFNGEAGGSGTVKMAAIAKPQIATGAAKYEPRERTRTRSMRSPVHEKVMQEDPSVKYDLLNELGMFSIACPFKHTLKA